MFNRATLIGHIGGDPEVRNTASVRPGCAISLTTSEFWCDADSGEMRAGDLRRQKGAAKRNGAPSGEVYWHYQGNKWVCPSLPISDESPICDNPHNSQTLSTRAQKWLPRMELTDSLHTMRQPSARPSAGRRLLRIPPRGGGCVCVPKQPQEGLKLMKKLVVACILAALYISPAYAADLYRTPQAPAANALSWTGPYIALGAGYSVDTLDTGAVSVAAEGLRLSGRLGYDWQWGHVVAGPFADIAWTNARVASNFAEVDLTYAAGARLGVVMGGTLLYANAGWEWQDFNDTGAVAYHPDGFFAGGGIEASLGNGFAIGLEGRHAWRSDDNLDNEATTAMLLLSKRF